MDSDLEAFSHNPAEGKTNLSHDGLNPAHVPYSTLPERVPRGGDLTGYIYYPGSGAHLSHLFVLLAMGTTGP